jgi:hypothetical protein
MDLSEISLFKNKDKSKGDKRPDFVGNIRVAGWVNTKKDEKKDKEQECADFF